MREEERERERDRHAKKIAKSFWAPCFTRVDNEYLC